MIVDVWKIITVIASVYLGVMLVGPSITGLFSMPSASGNGGLSVELFVMSYCPYGIQAEQGIIPAVQALGDSVDFSVKFVDYIMHGKQEIDENLREYCIQKEQYSKFLDYLSCFLTSKNSASCITSAGIDSARLNACVSASDAEFNITNLYNDRSSWNGGSYPQFPIHSSLNAKYGVQGSPTLVVNGTKVNPSDRSAQGFLTAICNVMSVKPDACADVLSSGAAATSGSCS